jgi:hypothetical protein
MVIRGGDVTIECGGAAMVEARSGDHGAIHTEFAAGTQIGKRYVDSDGSVELLCVKPGKGSLSIGGIALQTKDAKALPSSD